MLTGGEKKVVIITVCRMVESSASGVNSSIAQCQRRVGKVESAKTIRKRQIKELAARANKRKVSDVIVSGDFNERTNSDDAKSFMNETGSHDFFAEMN